MKYLNMVLKAIVPISALLLSTPVGAESAQLIEGKKLYELIRTNKRGERIGCSTCHTDDPRKKGLSKANKVIEPLAPSVNPERFTDPAKVEKWFTRNCKEVLDRLCTSQEKNNFIQYVSSLK